MPVPRDVSPDALYSTTELAELAGVNRRQLARWVERGVLEPARTGHRGRGAGHRWTPRHVEVVTLLARLRGSDIGYVEARRVLQAIVPEADLTRDAWVVVSDRPELARAQVVAPIPGVRPLAPSLAPVEEGASQEPERPAAAAPAPAPATAPAMAPAPPDVAVPQEVAREDAEVAQPAPPTPSPSEPLRRR